ncbi:TolC family protein [Candidatus Auribacterota bacterium]
MRYTLLICFFTLLFNASYALAENEIKDKASQTLPIKEFLKTATENDTYFEEILIEELKLSYQKDLKLSASDLVLEVKGEYEFILNQNREEWDSNISLEKLFPKTGTAASLSYQNRPSYSSETSSSDLTFSLSQPIAQNAFGKLYKLKDKVIGLEIDIAKHQIIEAYEDYLALLLIAYYNWYEAYQNLLIGDSSYKENIKLLDNVKARQQSKIAVGLDVNKTKLQLLKKQKKLTTLKEEYNQALNVIKTAIRDNSGKEIVPQKPDWLEQQNINHAEKFKIFTKSGRTFKILNLLEEKSTLNVDSQANQLLPSIDFILGYNINGDDFRFNASDNLISAGLSLKYPFGNQIKQAEYEIAKIEEKQSKLSSKNTYFRLSQNLKNLYLSLKNEKELLIATEQGVELAETVLADETKNYTYGKVTLNDYIDAVNAVDDHQFDLIYHSMQIKKLIIEYLRLTDKLIAKKDVRRSLSKT